MGSDIGTLQFEWDDEKERINFLKHNIHFETAKLVFQDRDRIEKWDKNHSDWEDRYQTIGRVDEVLFVVYTERRDSIRIISARVATNEERKIYYDRKKYFD